MLRVSELKFTLQGGVQSSRGFNWRKTTKTYPWTRQNHMEKRVLPMVDLRKPTRLNGLMTQMTHLPVVSPRAKVIKLLLILTFIRQEHPASAV